MEAPKRLLSRQSGAEASQAAHGVEREQVAKKRHFRAQAPANGIRNHDQQAAGQHHGVAKQIPGVKQVVVPGKHAQAQ